MTALPRPCPRRSFGRLIVATALGVALLAAPFTLSGCKTPPQDRDTNHSNYNYSYNK